MCQRPPASRGVVRRPSHARDRPDPPPAAEPRSTEPARARTAPPTSPASLSPLAGPARHGLAWRAGPRKPVARRSSSESQAEARPGPSGPDLPAGPEHSAGSEHLGQDSERCPAGQWRVSRHRERGGSGKPPPAQTTRPRPKTTRLGRLPTNRRQPDGNHGLSVP